MKKKDSVQTKTEMRFEVKRLELMRALEKLSAMKLLKNSLYTDLRVTFWARDEKLILKALSGNTVVSLTIPALVYEGGCFSPLAIRTLFDILTLRHESEVQFEAEGSKISLSFFVEGKPTEDEISLKMERNPDFPNNSPSSEAFNRFSLSEKNLKSCLVESSYAVSTDENRSMLCAINLKIEGNLLYFVSTDGNRLVEKSFDPNQEEEKFELVDSSFLIPAELFRKLLVILRDNEDAVSIYFEGDKIFLSGEGWAMSSLKVSGQFPNYESIIPSKFDTKVSIPRTELLRSIKLAGLVTDQRSGRIFFTFNRQGLFVVSEQSEEGFIRTKVSLDSVLNRKGDDWMLDETRDCLAQDVTLAFNKNYLQESLSRVKDSIIHFEMIDHKTVIVIRTLDKSCLHMIMPMNLS